MKERYLGDGVYARIDEWGLVSLMTGSHDNPENIVHLEPEVLSSMLDFIESAKGMKITVEKVAT